MKDVEEFDIIAKLDISTKNLHLDIIQEVLLQIRKSRMKLDKEWEWSKILLILWDHLETGLKRIDDQLLCSVCFFTALQFSPEKQVYLEKVFILVKNELALKDVLKLNNDKKLINAKKTFQVVSLMYGMLQSKFVVQISYKDLPIIVDLLNLSLDLFIQMAYEYSRYTFIVFKIISSFKIFLGTELDKVLFHTDGSTFRKLLTLANENWENPITGVRDLNKSIFQIVLSICSNVDLTTMLANLEKMYWNKAKYLMVAVMLEQRYNVATPGHWIKLQIHWIDGLMSSLSKPGLVSAGADMYFAVIKLLPNEDEWCELFLNRIIGVLQGTHNRAIDNFCNYWCLTTLKKFPGVANMLIDKLSHLPGSQSKLHSSLCVLKQANKLGLLQKEWNSESYGFVEHQVLDGIQHPNTQIRMLAFEVIAITIGKTMPSPVEYKLILDYLHDNVNSDCTVLRISMLGNINCFLTHLCASYMEHTKQNQGCEMDDLQNFYLDLQHLIIDSLNFDGNYQRKITTIKLCHTLLSSLNEVSKKRRKQISTSGMAMIKFLKEKGSLILFNDDFVKKLIDLLKDPADDIRDMTVQLLLDHYSKDLTVTTLNNLIKNAKNCIRSKFFYQISCGQSMFRLITSLLLKEDFRGETTFENVEEVFNFAVEILKSECELKRDIMKSIESGKQLHAYIGILQEVLKVSKQFIYEIKHLKSVIPQLLNILEVVADQFAWEDEPAVSSDFSKMSDMVQSIIASSGYNPLDNKDFSKISGLQQIVLNCLWLNVKASCDFAACLITSFTADSEAESCEKCLGVITHVLETSRHKGAIEAAGAALGRSIQHLTSLSEESTLSRLPRTLLECKLTELISHAAAASVTRRGAGLSIMVHRIVSSDMEKGKPLFHYFMETLLQTCNANEIVGSPANGQRDVPKAIYIHFLTRIVTDSSLASDMMFYSSDLAEIAFGNLTSPHWQIRNAALQLYGALVPKLIGQKKASGTDEETVGTVAVDEFRTHSPKLWQHMMTCLQELDNSNTVESHSNVLPILNVIANLAKRYNFGDATFTHSEELLEKLLALLGSPIFTVRRLTAKCIFNVYDSDFLDNISSKIINTELISENLLHGYLILVQHYFKYLRTYRMELDMPVIRQLNLIMNQRNHSYVVKTEFEQFSNEPQSIQDVLSEARCNKYLPGVHHWANVRLEKCIRSCSWDEIPIICKVFLKENDYEKYLEFILDKLQSEGNVPAPILTEIGDILLVSENKFRSCVIWKILRYISLQGDCKNIEANMIDKLEEDVPHRTRYVIPFLASVADKIPENYLIKLSKIILSLCDPDKSDVEMRYIAALANNELAKVFPKVPDNVRISSIKCAVLLLQDEDEDVRIINIQFYSTLHSILEKQSMILQPFVCLTKILNMQFLESCLDDPKSGIPVICKDLSEILVSYAKTDGVDEYNPFSNDSKNIYFESEVVKKLINKM